MLTTIRFISACKRGAPYIYICVLALLVLWMPDLSFAQTADDTFMNGLEEYYTTLLRFISRARIIPCIIAGKLMSNDFVFGAAFHMDVILWGLRNIVRTFVNFLVGFWFLKIIGSALISMDIKGMAMDMLRLFLAAILIQSSWFIMSATVDMGTAATAAVGGLAQTVFSDDRAQEKNYLLASSSIQVKDGAIDERYGDFTISGSTDFTLEQILPSADSVSGPLLFIGVSILEFNKATTLSTDAQGEISQKVTKSLLKLAVILMYTLPIVLLAVVAVVRLVYLWLWIILSPLIMFDRAMSAGGGSGGIKGLTEKMKATPGEVLGLVFVPAAVVGCMSIGLILVVSMYGVISQRGDYTSFNTEVLQSAKPAIIQGGASATAQIDGSLFKDIGYRSSGIVGEMLLAILTIALLRGLLKVGFSVSSVTKDLSEQAFEAVKKMAITTPIIPLGDYGSTSIGGLTGRNGAANNFAKYMGLNKEEREAKNQERAEEVTGALNITKSANIKLKTLNSIRSLDGFSAGDPRALTAAQKEIVSSKDVGSSIEYGDNTEKMMKEWLSSGSGPDSGYGYIQRLLPDPDKGKMTQEEFVASKYMTRFLKYVFDGNDVSKGDSLRAALSSTTISDAPGSRNYAIGG